jgi:hypothetical protein
MGVQVDILVGVTAHDVEGSTWLPTYRADTLPQI